MNLPETGVAGPLLVVRKGITIEEIEDNERIFNEYPLIRELVKQGLPPTTVNSILNCGKVKDFMTAECGCGKRVVPITNHCDSRNCLICAPRRKARIMNKYLRFLQSFEPDGFYSHRFLTVGPPNYEDLEIGLADIRFKITKWRKHGYIKERIKAGIFVIETKQKDDFSYNIHAHMIIWSKYLDNKIRGHCLDCGQNLMDFSKEEGYFCANYKCHSKNVVVKKDSKLKSSWRELFNEECHFYIKKVGSVKSALEYLLKYVTKQEGDFQSVHFEALYIKTIRNSRLISSFGDWYGVDLTSFIIKNKIICPICYQQIIFKYNSIEVSNLLYQQNKPPPDLNQDSKAQLNIQEVKI